MFTLQRTQVLATLCFCISLHQARGDLAVSQQQSSDGIVTNCSSLPSLLPPMSPSQGNQTVTLDFGQASPGNVSCVLTIPAYSNESSNAVTLMLTDTLPKSWCGEHNYLRLYDLDPESGKRSVIAEACDGVTRMSGRPGSDTLVVLEASGVERSNMTLLSYSSFRWSTAVCNPLMSDSAVLAATVNKTVLHVPDATHPLSRVTGCVWEVGVAGGKGVTHVRVTMQAAASAGRSVPGTYGNSSVFLFEDTGVFMKRERKQIPVTEKGVDFEETAIGKSALMSLVWRGRGGAPPFTLTYWADGSTLLCPPSPRSLHATHAVQAFKGVNRGLHESAQDRNCSWRISAPSGMVVKLVDIDNSDFRLHQKDKLVIDGKVVNAFTGEKLFPIWSEGESVEIDYVSSRMAERSQFVIKYVAVRPGPCQTLVTLSATDERNNVTEVALNKNDTINGTNCNWLFQGRPGHQVEVTVTLDNQGGLCQQPWSGVHMGGISAFRGADQTIDNLIEPLCLSDNNTWRFVSGDDLSVVYDRNPSTSYVTDGVTVTYIELPEPPNPPQPTGSACVFSPSVALLSFLLMLFFVH